MNQLFMAYMQQQIMIIAVILELNAIMDMLVFMDSMNIHIIRQKFVLW